MYKSTLLFWLCCLYIPCSLACEQTNSYSYLQEKAAQTKVIQDNHRKYIDALAPTTLPQNNPYKEIAKLYDGCFEEAIRRDSFSQFDNQQLQASFMILYEAYFLTLKRSIVEKVYWLMLEQQNRGIATNEQAQKIFNLAIQARDTDYARKLASKFELSDAAPNFVQRHDENAFLIRTENHTYSTQEFSFSERDLIVVSSPFCGPSKRFIQWYQDQGRFGALKDVNVFFLSPQEVPLGSHEAVYQELSHGIAYENDFWSDISYWSTPTFYYFEKGRLINARDGWAHSDSEAKIEDLLNE